MKVLVSLHLFPDIVETSFGVVTHSRNVMSYSYCSFQYNFINITIDVLIYNIQESNAFYIWNTHTITSLNYTFIDIFM